MRTTIKSLFAGFVFCLAAAGCGVDPAVDETEFLTGTEEAAVRLPDGSVACTNPDKVLVCHIPPGNPDNAHEICVGAPAVEAHQSHHNDTLGECAVGDDDDGGDDDGGDDDGGDDDGGGDEPPVP